MPPKKVKLKLKPKKTKVIPNSHITVNEKVASEKDADFYIKQIHHLEFKIEK